MQRTLGAAGLLGVSCLATVALAAPGDLDLLARFPKVTESVVNVVAIEDVDLDGDGYPDLLVSAKHDLLWRNIGRGQLTPLAALDVSGRAVAADLGGVGNLSIVSFSLAGIRAQTPTEPFLFGPMVQLATESYQPNWFEDADFNDDGATDLAATYTAGPRFWPNDGSGGLLPSVPFEPLGMDVGPLGDINADGHLDVLGKAGFVHLGNGDGTFITSPYTLSFGLGAVPVLCNVDDDGLLDLAFSQNGFTSVMRGQGTGEFTLLASGETGDPGSVYDVADADGDGHVELLARTAANGALAVHRIVGSELVALPGFQSNNLLGLPFVTFADLDGDGRSGALLLGNLGNKLVPMVIKGDGTGDLSVRKELIADELSDPAVADIDGDAQPEVLALRYLDDHTQEIACWTVGPEGTLVPVAPATHVPSINAVLRPLHLDTDAAVDVLAVEGGAVYPFRSNGDGTFTAGPQLSVDGPVFLGDVDADGDDDLIITEPEAHWYASLGDGTFAPSAPLVGPSFIPSFNVAIAIADVDGDGITDLLRAANPITGAPLSFYPGLGAGTYGAPITIGSPTASCAASIVYEDIDGDGDGDVVAFGGSPAMVTVVRTNGTGQFEAPITWQSFSYAESLILADLNADGLEDIVTKEVIGLDGSQGFSLQLADGLFSEARTALLGTAALDIDHDRDDDLLCSAGQLGLPGMQVSISSPTFAFIDVGHAVMGSVGLPILKGAGDLHAGAAVHIELRGAAPASPVHVVIGTSSLLQPPTGKDPAPGQIVIDGLATDAEGRLALAGHWPPGLPPHSPVYVQIWIDDALAPTGVAASNIVQLVED